MMPISMTTPRFAGVVLKSSAYGGGLGGWFASAIFA
jgi:hypothetical protein